MPAIRMEDLVKTFGDVEALSGLTLSVSSGELFGLLGPNGAGKTTTIGVLTGQTIPDSGSASVLDVDPVAHPVAVRERVGILPEKESPPSFLTPREYFQFVGAVRDLPDEQVDGATDEWAQRLGFNEKLDTLSSDLSRGQKQKVMIAAAFLHEPAAVFIDEPLANLDPLIQERVKRYLAEYREAGNTVLISTHNVDVAAELCTRVGILYDGRLLTDVRPADLDPDRSLLDVFVAAVDRAGAADTTLEDPVQDGGGEDKEDSSEQDRKEGREQDRDQHREHDRPERSDG